MKYSVNLIWYPGSKFTDANFSSLMLKGMLCHKRTLSTAVIHSAADFSAKVGTFVTVPSTLVSYLFFLPSILHLSCHSIQGVLVAEA